MTDVARDTEIEALKDAIIGLTARCIAKTTSYNNAMLQMAEKDTELAELKAAFKQDLNQAVLDGMVEAERHLDQMQEGTCGCILCKWKERWTQAKEEEIEVLKTAFQPGPCGHLNANLIGDEHGHFTCSVCTEVERLQAQLLKLHDDYEELHEKYCPVGETPGARGAEAPVPWTDEK